MTIKEAISNIDRLRPNQWDDKLKIKWLSVLDGQIWNEILQTHEGNTLSEFNGYDEETPQDTKLLVGYPYDFELYVYYLESQIDKAYNEIERYNLSATKFNHSYALFAAWYNRTHLPKNAGRIRF